MSDTRENPPNNPMEQLPEELQEVAKEVARKRTEVLWEIDMYGQVLTECERNGHQWALTRDRVVGRKCIECGKTELQYDG